MSELEEPLKLQGLVPLKTGTRLLFKQWVSLPLKRVWPPGSASGRHTLNRGHFQPHLETALAPKLLFRHAAHLPRAKPFCLCLTWKALALSAGGDQHSPVKRSSIPSWQKSSRVPPGGATHSLERQGSLSKFLLSSEPWPRTPQPGRSSLGWSDVCSSSFFMSQLQGPLLRKTSLVPQSQVVTA